MYINHNSLSQRRHPVGESKVVPVHAITSYMETEVLLHSFLTSALNEGELGNETANTFLYGIYNKSFSRNNRMFWFYIQLQ